MSNEEIIAHYNNTGAMSSIVDLLDLARADEREKVFKNTTGFKLTKNEVTNENSN